MRLVLLLAFLTVAPLSAQPADSLRSSTLSGTLTAAVHHAPPFAIKLADGTWDGAAVELWRSMGREAGFDAQLMEVDADSLLTRALSRGADVALTSTVTLQDLDRADFLPAYYAPRLGIAEKQQGALAKVLVNFFNPTFLRIVLGLSVMLLVVGVIVWAFERSENDEEFRTGKVGIWDGFWWAGVTMTTIGYGDKAPQSVGGRISALMWMLVSMAVTAALTTALVAALGVGGGGSGSSGGVQLPGDLKDKTVGAVAGSYAADVLRAEGLDFRTFRDLGSGLIAVQADSLDAFIDAVPVINAQLAALNIEGDVDVSSIASVSEQWALAVAPGSALREPLTRALLERTESPSWRAILDRYLSK